MAKLTATESKQLQPATELWDRYNPAKAVHAFRAKTAATARRWQARTRRALGECIGLGKIPGAAMRVKKLEQVERSDHIRQKLLLHTGPQTTMPVYLLLPKEAETPPPVMLAFHGHGYGVKDIIGLWEDGRERTTPEGYQCDFGLALCRAGFAVAAPEISCFGERQNDFSYLGKINGQETPSTCTHTAMLAFHLGISVVGLRVHDSLKLVDYLETRRDLDTSRLGAMGISGGGMHTLFSTALDTRIRACVISGYFSTFRDSILAMHHCACNFVPGLAAFGEMHDIAGLVAPRPMLIESGTYDPIFPIAAVRKGVADARKVFDVFGARDAVVTDYFEGRHQIHGAKAYPFLQQHLMGGA